MLRCYQQKHFSCFVANTLAVTKVNYVLLRLSYFKRWVALMDQIICRVFRELVLAVTYMILIIDEHLRPNSGLICGRYLNGIQGMDFVNILQYRR